MVIKQRYIPFLLAAFVLLVYYPAIHSPLCLVDDYDLLSCFAGRDINLLNVFFPDDVGYYRPLIHLVFYLEDYLWMLEESFLHLDTLLFHVVNVVLVYLIGLRTGRLLLGRERSGIAFCAALIFAVHPINTESVNWIAGRTDPLSGIFLFLSIYLLLTSLERNSARYLVLFSFSLFTACLAKETAIFAYPGLLFMIYCHDLHTGLIPAAEKSIGNWRGGLMSGLKSRWSQLRVSLSIRKYHYLATSLVPVLYFLLRKYASSVSDRSVDKLVRVVTAKEDSFSVISKSVAAIGFYLKKLFIPWPLNFNIVEISNSYLILGIILLALIVWLLWRQSLISSIFVCAIAIGSSSIFVMLGRVAWTPYAERYMYIPSALFAIGLVFLISDLFQRYRKAKWLPIIFLLVLGILTASTVQRNLVWMDRLSLYEDSLRKAPNFWRAWKNYAAALYYEGRNQEADEIRRILYIIKNRQNEMEVKQAFSSVKLP